MCFVVVHCYIVHEEKFASEFIINIGVSTTTATVTTFDSRAD